MDKDIKKFVADDNQKKIVDEDRQAEENKVETTDKKVLLGKELFNLEVYKTVSFEDKENYIYKANVGADTVYFFGSSVLNKQWAEQITTFQSAKILERDNLKNTRKYYIFKFIR
jgi:hypothetical protein